MMGVLSLGGGQAFEIDAKSGPLLAGAVGAAAPEVTTPGSSSTGGGGHAVSDLGLVGAVGLPFWAA